MLTVRHTARLIGLSILLSLSAKAVELRWVREGREIDKLAFRADVYLEQKNYKKAEPCFRKIYRSTKYMQNKASALYGQAVCLQHLGKHEKAVNRFKLAATSYGNYVPYEDALGAMFEITYEKFDRRYWLFGWRYTSDANPVRNRFALFSQQETAAEVYDFLYKKAPYSKAAPLAMFRRAVLGLNDEDERPRSIHLMELFLSRYRTHKMAPTVRARLIKVLLEDAQVSESDDKLLRRIRAHAGIMGQNDKDGKLDKKISDFLAKADKIESKHLRYLGEFYQKPTTNRPRAARRYLEALIRRFPASPLKAQAEIMLSTIPILEPLPFADRTERDKKEGETDQKPWGGGPIP